MLILSIFDYFTTSSLLKMISFIIFILINSLFILMCSISFFHLISIEFFILFIIFIESPVFFVVAGGSGMNKTQTSVCEWWHSFNHAKDPPQTIEQRIMIKVENENLINRLVNITKSKRAEVAMTGPYSRYNNNERSFRKKNPYRDETQRKITIENE